MAETATTFGQAVFRAWQERGGKGLYLDTTRTRTDGEVAFHFTEAHSHATGHLVHRPGKEEDPEGVFGSAKTLVILDDETTTGSTATNLVNAYQAATGNCIPVHLVVLVRWAAAQETSSGYQTHALLEGDFTFTPSDHFIPEPLKSVDNQTSIVAKRGTRHGVVSAQVSPWEEAPKGRVLVIGVGEFGFIPLVFAEQIEAQGGEAFLQATTRSPVALGGAIRHIRSFPALSGEGYTEYLYNVPEDHPYERVILCCEHQNPPEKHPVWNIPRLECRLLP